MPRNRNKIIGAMFDVKPVDNTGAVDVSKVWDIPPQINLRKRKNNLSRPKYWRGQNGDGELHIEKIIKETYSRIPEKSKIFEDLHQLLNARGSWKPTLTSLGIRIEGPASIAKPRRQPINIGKKSSLREIQERVLREMRQPLEPAYEVNLPEPELAAADIVPINLADQAAPAIPVPEQKAIEEWYHASLPTAERIYGGFIGNIRRIIAGFVSGPGSKKRIILTLLIVGLVAYGAVFAVGFRNKVAREGSTAVNSLEQAKTNLEKLDFTAASEDFLAAYNEFSHAGDTLNFMGANISSFLSGLPGGGQFKSAKNLVSVGQLVANAGQAMSDAVGTIAKTGLILNPGTSSKVFLSEIMAPLREALVISGKNLKDVSTLLADIDISSIPEEKQSDFKQFVSELPGFEKLVDRGAQFANFFERLIGSRGEKKYLLLFQNNSELRPTGGFAGTYGVLTFENGRLKDFFVDDVYNIDGQLKELIVPPLELQHITPNWAMRDAAWFINFPDSAQKLLSFYRKEANKDLNGVITMSPDIIAEILKVVGPIQLPEYNLTLTNDNFLPEVQREVEYGEDKKINKPKKIITDLAPILMQRLYSADKSTWLNIMGVLMGGLEQKNVLMYFKDQKLQAFSQEQGFSGEVKDVNSDYLMVTFSNIKGSKTDQVTDTTIKVDTKLAQDSLNHKLVITRQHTGGNSKYGFYNRQNSSYVRVLVPKGAQLVNISGNSDPSFKPLIDYPKTNFTKDLDLMRLEQGSHHDNGVFESSESDKTSFGFWMIIDPGEIKTVELEYTLPALYEGNTYELYIQKQPGLRVKDFSWDVSSDGLEITGSNVALRNSGSSYSYNGEMTKDLQLIVQTK